MQLSSSRVFFFFRARGGWDFMATMLLSMREFSYSKKSMSSTQSLLD